MPTTFAIHTEGNFAYDIQANIDQVVRDSGITEGIAVVVAPHSTAALGIISPHDPLGLEDVMDEYARLIPARIDFKHEHDTPQDAAGHVKSTLLGPTLSLIVSGGEVYFGHSQKVFFLEFDGPRKRKYSIQVVGQ